MELKCVFVAMCVCIALCLAGCASGQSPSTASVSSARSEASASMGSSSPVSQANGDSHGDVAMDDGSKGVSDGFVDISISGSPEPVGDSRAEAERLRKKLKIVDMNDEYRELFEHGDKGAKYQKYIVLHDTEGDGKPADIVHYWGGNDNRIAAHFVVGKDGSVVQCVDMDKIAHHAGFGDTGHNKKYGVRDESRDDKVGTEPIGDWASDYGMNSYSIGIEMVHVGGEGGYPKKQLEAIDDLIAYIDAYYGKESKIIDHKAWRSGNSDTSKEFAKYLKNYQDHRTHD